MRKHQKHKCKNEDCYLCNSGLYMCEICGAIEGELTTECFGQQMSSKEKESVFKKEYDFKNNSWIKLNTNT